MFVTCLLTLARGLFVKASARCDIHCTLGYNGALAANGLVQFAAILATKSTCRRMTAELPPPMFTDRRPLPLDLMSQLERDQGTLSLR